jgi:alpha-L-arabinofuranosidase
MANYAQTVNVIGAVKTTATPRRWSRRASCCPLPGRFGTLPVNVDGAPAPLDVAAAWTADRSALTVAVVNPTGEQRRLRLELAGAVPTGAALRFVLSGSDRWARNGPGRSRGVDVERTSLTHGGDRLDAPPLSVVLHVLPVR